ncbi:MAG: S-methyl-5'-thioinosine phosphorylase [Xanthomonadales bacterium]|nr:S-methyl-5'-thioinosine phosphorylase [Gammaproteobacteria bacterium]MBT8053252.1 S-methyl-5'-thioinosine phosphorylase [Gammaproteobacteria bacterium]NND56053.1 S-methyl-5'-thioinosine phosphorylase [Xanthomonadales bacterium]NNK50292.1 S-methyl-5'-thioinosine phosphorylase [Xanthomonadales bacterium]
MSSPFTLALLGGTGLTELADRFETSVSDTPYGAPSSPVRVIQTEPVTLLFLPRHGNPHRLPPHRVNYRANMWALRKAGADAVLAVSAVGGITEAYAPGVLAAPDQLVDYSWGREHTYCDSGDVNLVHVDFSYPYSGPLRKLLLTSAASQEIDLVDGGCIGVFQGPRLESAAEIERSRRDGCDMAGMTSLPEAGLARELGLDYAGIAVVSNWGAGVHGELISEDNIAETLREPMTRVRALVQSLIPALAENHQKP